MLLFAPIVRRQPHGFKVYVDGDDSERGFPVYVSVNKVSLTISALRSAMDQELEEAFESDQADQRESVLPLLCVSCIHAKRICYTDDDDVLERQ